MPYEWLPAHGTGRLVLRPHQSLGARGFVAFIGATALMLALPVLSLLGQTALWLMLMFAGLAIAALWTALRLNARALQLTEVLTLTPDLVRLERRGPGGRQQDWQANPYWVQVTLYPTGGPVPHYLTLKGDGREVEIGAFLTPEERQALADELRAALAAANKETSPKVRVPDITP